MALANIDHLKHYVNLRYNVLFRGLHGVGKTAIVKKVFNEMGLRWKYFSASTLDPWVDFVGVPETVKQADGSRYLDLVRPKFIIEDSVDAIFFDELNRAPDKVLNAIMELIQFQSINGHRLNNLKVIWGAINPEDDDDTYSVNHLDPAFLDRFHVHKEIPYKVDEEYFKEKYPGTSVQFIDWWNDLPDEQKKLVSPRRLDYAAAAFDKDCRLEDFLPHTSNVKKLRSALKSLPFQERMLSVTTDDQAKAFIEDVNNSTKLLELVKIKDSGAIEFFEKYGKQLPKELVTPFVEVVFAQKRGMMVVSSIEELINTLDNGRGNQATAALINNVDLTTIYKDNGSLENDLRTLKIQKRHLLQKLATRIVDIVMSCQIETLDRIMWGTGGFKSGSKQNVQVLAKMLSIVDRDLYTGPQRTTINTKLYQHDKPERRVINDMHWL